MQRPIRDERRQLRSRGVRRAVRITGAIRARVVDRQQPPATLVIELDLAVSGLDDLALVQQPYGRDQRPPDPDRPALGCRLDPARARATPGARLAQPLPDLVAPVPDRDRRAVAAVGALAVLRADEVIQVVVLSALERRRRALRERLRAAHRQRRRAADGGVRREHEAVGGCGLAERVLALRRQREILAIEHRHDPSARQLGQRQCRLVAPGLGHEAARQRERQPVERRCDDLASQAVAQRDGPLPCLRD